MFDTIIVDKSVELPQPANFVGFNGIDFHERSYQTKDRDCLLSTYKLINGEILEYKVEKRFVEDKSHFLGGYMDVIPNTEKWVKCSQITDYIYFYDLWYDFTPRQDAWIEFVVHIINGDIKEIKLFKFDLTDNEERKERNKKFDEELKKHFNRSKLQKFVDDIRYHLRIKLLWLNNKHIDFANWINNQIHKI